MTININDVPYNKLIIAHNKIGLYRFKMEQLQGIDLNSNIPYNDYLAGHIESEFLITDEKTLQQIDSLVTPVVANYDQTAMKHEETTMRFMRELEPPILTELWVNRQKKYEYNPMHHHRGVYSFVLWCDIPYTPEEEEETLVAPKKTNNSLESRNVNGCFQFFWNNNIFTLADGKDWNGTLAVFPSNLYHCVNPFYSTDKDRITIAGNYRYDNRN